MFLLCLNYYGDECEFSFHFLIFDNRGVGQTKDAGFSFNLETMAEDTLALIQKLGLKRPHILGQSMGGAIAQILALPGRVADQSQHPLQRK